jgi:phage terminase large subunit
MVLAWDIVGEHIRSAMEVAPQIDRGRYPDRIADFIIGALGCDLWEKQIEIAESVNDHRYTAVASCHGAGKSFIAARIAIAFLHVFPGSIVITTAPTARQVQHVLWREINRAFRDSRVPLLGRCLTTRYEIAPDWYAIGFKAQSTGKRTDESDAWQGFHAEHALVIIDEAAGVQESVFDTLDAVMSSEGARALYIGNPTSVSGTFRNAFHKDRGEFNTIRISAFDTPNLAIMPEGTASTKAMRPYLVTREWVDNQIRKRGNASPYVQSRVYANFPDLGTNKLIPLSWIEAANERNWQRSAEGRGVVAGVDVARYGDDESSMAVRRGPLLIKHVSWHGSSITETAATVVRELQSITRGKMDVDDIRVDAIGLGAGVADILREKGFDVTDVNASNRASDPEMWPNFRHEMWWQLRDRFNIEHPRIAVADSAVLDDDTMAQLSDIEYSYKDTRFEGALVEPKEETKKRTGWSPDRAEAMALAYCTLPPPEIAASRTRSVVAKDSGWGNAMTAQKSRGAKIARAARRKVF